MSRFLTQHRQISHSDVSLLVIGHIRTRRTRVSIDANVLSCIGRLYTQYDQRVRIVVLLLDLILLGVILISQLKWKKHIDVVLSKISKCLGILSKVRHLVPVQLTRLLYLTLVEPYMAYCNIIWCQSKKNSNLDKIFKLQKRYCRLMMFTNFRAPSRPLFSQLKLLNIYQIYKYQLAIYMFKIVHKLVPHLNHQLFSTGSSIHGYDTRFKDALRKHACRTKLPQSTFCFQGPKLWNNLADPIKSSPSLTIFKKNLKISLLSEVHCY